MPELLRRDLVDELGRTGGPACPEEVEWAQSGMMARLLLRRVAPRLLRQAGYEALATGCEDPSASQAGRAVAFARNEIRRELDVRGFTPGLVDAHHACALAEISEAAARGEELWFAVGNGESFVRAIVRIGRDGVVRDSEWTWGLTVAAIKDAARLRSGQVADGAEGYPA